MVEIMLTRALRKYLERAVERLKYRTPGGSFKAPDVINGFLPPKRDAKDDFPFVLVLPVKGATDDDRTEVEVRIEVGAWAEDYAGYEDAMALMSCIRNALIMLPDRTLDGRFRLQTPVSWDMSDEQPYPGWLMDMTSTWEMHSPEVGLSNEADVYGNYK